MGTTTGDDVKSTDMALVVASVVVAPVDGLVDGWASFTVAGPAVVAGTVVRGTSPVSDPP